MHRLASRSSPKGCGGRLHRGRDIKWGLSGFSNDTVWLIFAAYVFAAGDEKTGLGRRIALAPNLLATDIAAKTGHVHLSWTQWFVAFLPVGALLFLALPALIYVLYPPETKSGEEVVGWARAELQKMGRIGRNELVMAGLALTALVLWIGGGAAIGATAVALLVIAAMIVLRVLSWDDALQNKQA